jgi:hypothetical protein
MKRLALLIFFFFALSGIAQAGNMDWLRVDGTSEFHGKTYFYDEIELGGENVSDIVDVIDGTVTHDDLATALSVKDYADDIGDSYLLVWDETDTSGLTNWRLLDLQSPLAWVAFGTTLSIYCGSADGTTEGILALASGEESLSLSNGDLSLLLDNGSTYTNFGDSNDDTVNEMFAAIDAAWPSGGGSPGGTDGQVQYNNGGVFGGFGFYDDTTGYFGIGTNSPQGILHTVEDGGYSLYRSESFSDTASDRAWIQLCRTDGSVALPGAIDDDDHIGTLAFVGYTGTQLRIGADITARAKTNWIEASDYGTEIDFQTVVNGSTTKSSRLKIDENGKIRLASGTGVNDIVTTIDGTVTHDDLATALAIKSYADGISGGAPGGSEGAVQYKSGSSFAGDTLYWDATEDELGIGVDPAYKLHIRDLTDIVGLVLQRNSVSSNTDIGYVASVAHDGSPVMNTQIKMRSGATSDSGQIYMYTANTSGSLQEVFRANEYGNIGLSNADPSNTYAVRVGGSMLVDGGTLRCNYGFEMWDQDAWIRAASDDGSTVIGGIKGSTSGYVGFQTGSLTNHPIYFVGNSTVRAMMTSGGNWGFGELVSLNEKVVVNGAIRIGSTSGSNAGTIRWNGSKFQGYTGSAWVDFH